VMARYHAELRAILERHGGTVEKFVGDAAMAVFGIPQAHEDDALRAVRAADEIRETVVPIGVEVRIGVNTGQVVAGDGETLVTGDAVNVAARLEQVAEPGQILLGEATQILVRGRVRIEAVEPLALKGKAEPTHAYCLLELLPEVPAWVSPLDTPFVGRKHELEKLERTLARAVSTRAPQLVTTGLQTALARRSPSPGHSLIRARGRASALRRGRRATITAPSDPFLPLLLPLKKGRFAGQSY
jgi:hypothetical protein